MSTKSLYTRASLIASLSVVLAASCSYARGPSHGRGTRGGTWPSIATLNALNAAQFPNAATRPALSAATLNSATLNQPSPFLSAANLTADNLNSARLNASRLSAAQFAAVYGGLYGRHNWNDFFGPNNPFNNSNYSNTAGSYLGGGYPSSYGYGYPGGYSGGNPGATYNSYSYSPTSYFAIPALQPVPAAAQPLAAAASAPDDRQNGQNVVQFFAQAKAAFLAGDYRNALRLAGHADLEAPGDPKVHELISLAWFAAGNYNAAAGEAHAAMATGTVPQWRDLYHYYNDVDQYTAQLRTLEKAAIRNPTSPAQHFLLAYHYLVIGARDKAKRQLALAAQLTPDDQLAEHYLQQLQSNSPLTPPNVASGSEEASN